VLWVGLSLLTALSLALSDALLKKALRAENETYLAWLRLLLALPLLLLALAFTERPPLDEHFFRAFLLALPLEVAALLLYVRAIRMSPLGLTLPFLAFTPVLLILFGYAIAGERVSLPGVAGIALMSLGSYSLNLQEARKGFLEPFKALGRQKGPLLMMAVALIYSLTSSLGKVAIVHSSALFFGATYFVAVTGALAPFALRRRRPLGGRDLRYVALSGLLYGLMIITHMLAMSMAKVAYMIALKRTSVLFGVLLGHWMFQEAHVRVRLLGATLMLLALLLISTAGP
jgi:drug/metabolite transporter (DMT)-like permease